MSLAGNDRRMETSAVIPMYSGNLMLSACPSNRRKKDGLSPGVSPYFHPPGMPAGKRLS